MISTKRRVALALAWACFAGLMAAFINVTLEAAQYILDNMLTLIRGVASFYQVDWSNPYTAAVRVAVSAVFAGAAAWAILGRRRGTPEEVAA